MPMIDQLLTDLQKSPPSTPEELETMLSATGYDLVPSEEGMMEQMDDDMMMDEALGGEALEDMGPEEEMMGEEEVMEEEAMPMPMGMPMDMQGAPSRGEMTKRTRDAAKKALMG